MLIGFCESEMEYDCFVDIGFFLVLLLILSNVNLL